MRTKETNGLNESAWRMWVVYAAIAVVFGYYALRLFTLQVVEGPSYLAQADENRITEVSVQTERGIIYDRNGVVLARNVASYNVTVTPALLPVVLPLTYEDPVPGADQEVYRRLSALIDVPVSAGAVIEDGEKTLTDEQVRLFKPCDNDLGIKEIVYIQDSTAPYSPVRVKCNIDQETAMIIREKARDWPGVGVEIEPIREYPTGDRTAEIIGFLGPIPESRKQEFEDKGFIPNRDKVGYAGIEFQLQDILAGRNGKRVVEVDVAGKELRDVEEPINSVPGDNIRLTIDIRLQNAAKAALKGEIDFWNTYFNTIRTLNGVVVAVNPKTGEVLALVSEPTYENNRMARVIPGYYYEQLSRDKNRPLFNHAISAEHPPGSVFKMATAIGALNERVVTPETTVEDPGKITITQKFTPNDPGTDREYVCWDENGHGIVDFLHGVAWSCDVYFYKIGGGYKDEVKKGLGATLLAEYAKALGYGEITGVELPGEQNGLMPTPDWKRVTVGENWSTGDTYIASMGQGFVLSTPMQVLSSFSTLANNGKYMKPTLIREILDPNGNIKRPFEPQMHWDITKDPRIMTYDAEDYETGVRKVVEPWVIELAKRGMRMVVEDGGTAFKTFKGETIPSAGKTGTAEYCDNVAQDKNLCQPGSWPTHSWYSGYAPYDDPEIAVVAFVYNGGEGASVAAPVVKQVIEAYFELKAIDTARSTGQPAQ